MLCLSVEVQVRHFGHDGETDNNARMCTSLKWNLKDETWNSKKLYRLIITAVFNGKRILLMLQRFMTFFGPHILSLWIAFTVH